ncbi:hypothetical protein BSR29_04785 [Boudabousia liubingyangii]|uniref:Nudix hydrolase domain-containing protein n=2 Tax=Boudabousia liubingyangii TaxID=1921764 RepID=A0A1Q5PNY6_9ACTO|nr:hypothetical protein BSR28_04350 [Boudabousia liubingyangii]OKL49150.1 hypothetical protein BSR29_04785 [Boudabousia liubingyangii]
MYMTHTYPRSIPQKPVAEYKPIAEQAVATLVVLGGGLAVIAFIATLSSFQGIVNHGVAPILLASIPALIVGSTILYLDRLEPEPWLMLTAAFLWGAGIAIWVALILNDGYSYSLYRQGYSGPEISYYSAVIGAPINEEFIKAVGLILIVVFARRNLSSPHDGMIYGAMIGLGFAVVEDVLYFSRADNLTASFIGRGLLTPFSHSMFTSLTGLGIAWGVTRARTKGLATLVSAIGLISAMLAHSLFNNIASNLHGESYGGALANLVISVFPLYLLWAGLLAFVNLRQTKSIQKGLDILLERGYILPEERNFMSTTRSRRDTLKWAATMGSGYRRKMRALQRDLSALALSQLKVRRSQVAATKIGSWEVHRYRIISNERQLFLTDALMPQTGQPVFQPQAQGTMALGGPAPAKVAPQEIQNVFRPEQAVPEFTLARLAQNELPRPSAPVTFMPYRPAARLLPASGPVPAQPGDRECVRTLVCGPNGEVLMMHGFDQLARERTWLYLVGGGIENPNDLAGEVIRELWEETGIKVPREAVSSEITSARIWFDFNGYQFWQHERYFRINLGFLPEITTQHWTAQEAATNYQPRWWSREELRAWDAAGGEIVPENLFQLLSMTDGVRN